MDGYTILAGFLIFFFLFIYLTWFGFSVKVENEKEEQSSEIKINPYDNLPLSRRFIDKKNPKVGIFDLGNHILIIGVILLFMFLKAGLIMAFFMHVFWERYALVNVLLWPMTAIGSFIFLMVAEFEYTVFTRLFYFVVGGQ